MSSQASLCLFIAFAGTADLNVDTVAHVNRHRDRRRANRNVRFKADKEVQTQPTVDVILSDLLDAIKSIQQVTQRQLSEEEGELKGQSTPLVTKCAWFRRRESPRTAGSDRIF